MPQWVEDLERQIAAAELALAAPEVTLEDLQSILHGPYPTTIEEFEAMISQRQVSNLLSAFRDRLIQLMLDLHALRLACITCKFWHRVCYQCH